MTVAVTGLWGRLQEVFEGANAPEIARITDRTKQTVYRWRDGESPGLDVLLEIAKSRRVSLHWLVTGEGSKKLSDDNGSSHPRLQTDRPEVELREGSEEKLLVAHMQLIIEQNNRIIHLLERLVAQK